MKNHPSKQNAVYLINKIWTDWEQHQISQASCSCEDPRGYLEQQHQVTKTEQCENRSQIRAKIWVSWGPSCWTRLSQLGLAASHSASIARLQKGSLVWFAPAAVPAPGARAPLPRWPNCCGHGDLPCCSQGHHDHGSTAELPASKQLLHTFYLKFVCCVYILLPRAKCRQMLWGVECNKLYLTICFINSGPWEDLQSMRKECSRGRRFIPVMASCFSFPSFS